MGTLVTTPALNRWVSVSPSLAWHSLGRLLHNFLPRAFHSEFGGTLAARSREADEDNDMRAANRKRLKNCSVFMERPDSG